MKQLELKHIVGYLPYDLNFQHKFVKAKHKGETNLRLWQSKLEPLKLTDLFYKTGKTFDFNLLLRPLSDLTKEIEVNGEKIFPIKWLKQNYTDHKLKLEGNCIILSDSYSLEQDILAAPFAIIEKLYEWHFDIHGLIEKGLAIDINTLNK